MLSERLSKFWGRPMYLGAHILLPEGYDAHPNARYPLVINHGHFPDTIGGFREEPPDPNLRSEVLRAVSRLEGYNRTEQELAYQLYKDWTAPDYPRYLLVEIQHANPYYDDSYAVNSANLGPYGDAITYELIPYLEKKYRAIGAGWARFMYGGSTGGWEALAAQILYPDEYNGCWAACPDPIDFRQYTVVNIYEDENAYFWKGPFATVVDTPAHRDYLGHLQATVEQTNRLEPSSARRAARAASGTSGRRSTRRSAPTATRSRSGTSAPESSTRRSRRYWKENYDLVAIMKRDWDKGLGKKLAGKIHIYVGEADNYYLNNAVYLAEDFLRTTDPYYGGEIDYGPRAEHCWNGDHTRPNAISRLRYHQMFAPKIVERIEKSAPPGADLKSWRY